MKYVKLGKTGTWISRVCLGTMNFGMVTSKEEAFRILDESLDLGINFLDTSNSYGGYDSRGLSECIIGEWFYNNSTRNRIILADKVYHLSEKTFFDPNDDKGLSSYKIRRHLEDSLKRLKTDHIDLYQMHHIDNDYNWDEIWGEMNRNIINGKITYVGSSNFTAYDIAICNEYAKYNNVRLGLVSEQHRYNLLCRYPELEILPACKKSNMSLLVWGPLSAGLLADNPFCEDAFTRRAHNSFDENVRNKIKQYNELCADLNISCSEMALAWLFNNPNVGSVIIGPRTVEQLKSCVKSLEIDVSSYLSLLNSIFEPVGEAPVSYAW